MRNGRGKRKANANICGMANELDGQRHIGDTVLFELMEENFLIAPLGFQFHSFFFYLRPSVRPPPSLSTPLSMCASV